MKIQEEGLTRRREGAKKNFEPRKTRTTRNVEEFKIYFVSLVLFVVNGIGVVV